MEKKMEIKERRSLEQKEIGLIQNRKLPSDAIKSREKECGSNEPSHSFFHMDYRTGRVIRLRDNGENRGYAEKRNSMPLETPIISHRKEPIVFSVHPQGETTRNMIISNHNPDGITSRQLWERRQMGNPPIEGRIPIVPLLVAVKGKRLERNREHLRIAKTQEVEKKERHLNSVDKAVLFWDRAVTFQANKEKNTDTESDTAEQVYGEEAEKELNEMFGIPKEETDKIEDGKKDWGERGKLREYKRGSGIQFLEYKVCKRIPKVERVSGLKEVVRMTEEVKHEEKLDHIFGKRVSKTRSAEETTTTELGVEDQGDVFREGHFYKKERKKKKTEWEGKDTSKLQKKGREKIGRKQKIGRTVTLMKQGKYLLDVADKEMTSTYDAEERRKSATKDFLQKKLKEKVTGSMKRQAKKASLAIGKGIKNVAVALLKKVAVAIAPIAPYIAAGAAILCLFIGIIGAVVEYDRKQQETGTDAGFFGKMYFWIEYETGKTDETAFATILGDGGRAFGIQFDYRYTLQPFMRYCYTKNPTGYRPFAPYLYVDKNTLKGNQGLADAWTLVFYTNKEEFINDQKEYARANYYDDIEEKAQQFGLRLKERDETCKGAVLSYSFQCGSSAAYQAVKELTFVEGDEEFLRKIYALRTVRYPKFASRYERELQTALALLNSFLPGTGEFICPVDMRKCIVTSEFGEYRSPSDPSHNGIDLASYGGIPVPTHAIADGVVEIAGFSPSAGNWVVIDHGNGIKAKYMHHSSIRVAVGQKVRKGEQIGNMGSTGQSTGVHLHLQIELNGVPVNPRNYITIP